MAVLRTMIAVGGNVPLHWLAEAGEGNSEATSANMNEVSYRHYYSRQQFVARRIEHLCRYAHQRAAALGAAKPLLDPEIRAPRPATSAARTTRSWLPPRAMWLARSR